MAMTDENQDQQRVVALESLQETKKKKVFVVLNPVAGQTDADNSKQAITRFCEDHEWDCDIHETEKNEDLRSLVKEALKKGFDLVVAAGGDGTVSGVLAGMLNSEVPMAIVPAGTGNALARDLGIPLDLSGALNLLDTSSVYRNLDVMEVNGEKYYALNVSAGISSMIMRTTRRSEKRRFGMLAYLYRAIQSIRRSTMHRFQVKADDREFRFYATELLIANSKLMGIQPQLEGVEVDPNDGRMDMFIFRVQSFRDYMGVLSRFVLRRKRYGDPTINYVEAYKCITIQSEFSLPVQADGEEIGVTPVEVRLIPNSLRVIVPEK